MSGSRSISSFVIVEVSPGVKNRIICRCNECVDVPPPCDRGGGVQANPTCKDNMLVCTSVDSLVGEFDKLQFPRFRRLSLGFRTVQDTKAKRSKL